MSKKALEDTDYELIKAHILFPDESPLSIEKQVMLDRITSAAKILDKNPIQKNAVALHQQKYPEISRTQAYVDLRMAMRLYNSLYNFEHEMWSTWLIRNIIKNIQFCENKNEPNYRKILAMEHANLIKAIGERPEELPDPSRNEKHQFYILVQNNNQEIKIDINKLKDLPIAAIQELNKIIWGGQEISELNAEEIMKT